MNFLKKLFLLILFFNIEMIKNFFKKKFLILSFYKINVVCGFIEITQIAAVYSLFFSHIIRKIVLKKKSYY
jgi:hypothetical protein